LAQAGGGRAEHQPAPPSPSRCADGDVGPGGDVMRGNVDVDGKPDG